MKHMSLVALFMLCISGAWSQDIEKSFAVGKTPKVDVQTVAGDIMIVKGDVGQVVVLAEKTNDRIQVNMTQSGDRIRIKVHHPFAQNGRVDIRVTMPNGDVNARSTSGDIEIEGVKGQLEAQSVSGKLVASRLQGRLRLKSISGDVVFTRVDDSEIDGVSISGDVTYTKGNLGSGDYDFSSTSGDVTVYVLNDADITLSGRTISGDIADKTGRFEIVKSKYAGSERISGKMGKGNVEVQANTVSGDIRIREN